MVFFFLIPSIPAVLGNFLIPLMIGAKDLAFPRINLLSWYIYIIGGVFTLLRHDRRRRRHRLDVLHAVQHHARRTPTSLPTALGVFITGFSSILTGLNFIVTIHRMRAPGLTWFRLPLFVWAHYATSLIQVLGTPVRRHHHRAAGRSSGPSASASSTRPSAATRCCSSTCSGSTRTRPSTS